MDAGRRLERAMQLLSLLRATVTEARGTATDSLVLESVLSAAESIITYRCRYRSHASSRRCSTCCCSTPATRARSPTSSSA